MDKHQINISLLTVLHLIAQGRESSEITSDLSRNTRPISEEYSSETPARETEGVNLRFHPGKIALPRHILVIDDDQVVLDDICDYLKKHYGITVEGVQYGSEALKKIQQGMSYDLVLIDLTLRHENGLEVAEDLRKERVGLPIIYISAASADALDSDTKAELEASGDALSSKNLDEIVEQIDRLIDGYWEKTAEETVPEKERFVRQLGMIVSTRQSLRDKLLDMLVALRKEIPVSHATVLELDRETRTVTIVAVDPPLPDIPLTQLETGLYYSPVQDVIESEEEFRQNDIRQGWGGRFRNFFPLLSFQSCLGIPLVISDYITRYALFLLDERPDGFVIFPESEGEQRVRQARLSARFFAMAIERFLTLEFMRRYEINYSLGQLLADLVHEFNNKLHALRARIQLLQAILLNSSDRHNEDIDADKLGLVRNTINEIRTSELELEQLVDGYQRLAQSKLDIVAVNDVVRSVVNQLEQTARRRHAVKVTFKPDPSLPNVRGIYSQLQQVVMNLVLNAIQQIRIKYNQFEKISRERNNEFLLVKKGQVNVETSWIKDGDTGFVTIKVSDTGPGIHWRSQKQIFSMGFSGRGGAGLGLYISRNLVENIGGRLYLDASVLWVGSIFVVELPVYSGEGA